MSGFRGGRHKLLGSRGAPRPATQPLSGPTGRKKKRVLFVCIGNSCRSQMAEGFAKTYGSDIMDASSAGLSPATIIAPMTKLILATRNIQIDGHFPKGLEMVAREPYDLLVDMSGMNITALRVPVRAAHVITWPVPDPIGQKEAVYQAVVMQIERLVMQLILELRASG